MKTFTIEKHTIRSTSTYTGTVQELVEKFSYTLDCGRSYEREKGNKKINTNPKSIKSLVSNLNNAVNNSAANGYSSTVYVLVGE